MKTTPTPTHVGEASAHDSDVAVLGLGSMGSALAAALLESGLAVTVWNRTAAKARPLTDRGARVADDPTQAVGAAPVVLTCLLDHATVTDVVGALPRAADGRRPVLADLTTTTPAEARRTAEVAERAGWDHLDGAVMAIPSMIGRPEAVTLYSGDRAVFDSIEPVVRALGTGRWVGHRPGLASARDLAMLSAMYTMIAGLHQAIALARTAGISATDFVPELTDFVGAMVSAGAEHPEIFDSRDYTAVDQDLVFTRNAVDLIVRAAREEGMEPYALTPIQVLLAGEIDRGHGHRDTAALVEAFRADVQDRS